MKDIELVIKIPEEKFSIIRNKMYCGIYDSDLYKAIANGTPLPKGHGRLIDEKDILDTENNDGGWYDLVDMPEYIAGVKAIIEADTESEDKE